MLKYHTVRRLPLLFLLLFGYMYILGTSKKSSRLGCLHFFWQSLRLYFRLEYTDSSSRLFFVLYGRTGNLFTRFVWPTCDTATGSRKLWAHFKIGTYSYFNHTTLSYGYSICLNFMLGNFGCSSFKRLKYSGATSNILGNLLGY